MRVESPIERPSRVRTGVVDVSPVRRLAFKDVEPRKQRAADVGDPLVVQRPADLLVVMRDLELPQHRDNQLRVFARIDGGLRGVAHTARMRGPPGWRIVAAAPNFSQAPTEISPCGGRR
jgi:hypothetical protein